MTCMARPRTPLVGRSAELDRLVQLLDDDVSRQIDSLVLSGDAGVGKTRLLAELIERAAERGVQTLVGHCLDFGEPGLPYLPFSEAFGTLAREQPERVESLLAEIPAIGRLLPTRRIMGAPGDLPEDNRIERRDLFDAVLAALVSLAAEGPVLLVVEDAHWADQSTRDLLGFLLTRLRDERVSLVVSYRSDDLHRRHPLRPAVAEWNRLSKVERLQLAPLGAGDVRALIGSLHPGPMPELRVAQIINRAEGNAFFAEELIAATEQSSDSVPAELAELLLVRLDRLSPAARQVVRVAAVAGRRVTHGLLSAVADLPDGELDAALRDAIDAHVVEPRGEDGYGFRHALLAEAVYDDLLPGERTRLHAAYASALTKGGVDGTAAELARHARESHDLPTAYRASVRAGDEAMRVAAPQEAMQHYEAALQLGAHAPVDDDIEPGWLVRAAAEAAAAAGHQLRAVELIRDALAQLPPDTPALHRAKLLYDLATYTFTIESDDPLEWTTEAVGLMSAQPVSTFRARVAALHARTNSAMGRDVEAARWAQDALDMADELGQPEAAADARTTLAVLQRKAGDPGAAARDLHAVIDDARRSGEITAELRSRYSLGSLHYEMGELDAASDAFRAGVDRAVETGRQWAAYGLGCSILLSLVQYVHGDWDASLRTSEVSGRPPPPLSEASLAAAAMAVRAGRGDRSALQLLPVLRPWWRRDGMIAILTAGPAIDLYSQADQPERALALLDEVNGVITEIWQEPWYLGRIRLGTLAVAASGAAVTALPTSRRAQWVDRAAVLVDDGRASAERGKPAGRHLGIEAVAWLARLEAEWSRLRWLAGSDPPDVDTHVELWRRAVEAFGFGDVYEQARSRTRLAAVLRAAGRGAEAAEQATLARDVARRLGAEPLLAELRVLGTSRNPSREAAATGTGSLTSRERDVLALLVAGRTNRQISQQLYISAKTVSVHVSNILAKLGVSSRAEAAALARQTNRPS